MNPDHVNSRIRIPAPDTFHDLVRRQHQSRTAQKQFHQLEFPAAEPHGIFPVGQDPGGRVQRHISQGKHRGPVILPPAEHSPNPADKLVRLEGLGQVIVRSGVEAGDAVIFLCLDSEHHHRCFDALPPQVLQNGNAVHFRHHHIENDGIILGRFRIFAGGQPVVDRVHSKWVPFKKDGQRLGQVHFVLRNR